MSEEKPLFELPSGRKILFIASPISDDFCYLIDLRKVSALKIQLYLERRLLHETHEAAAAHGKAMCGIK